MNHDLEDRRPQEFQRMLWKQRDTYRNWKKRERERERYTLNLQFDADGWVSEGNKIKGDRAKELLGMVGGLGGGPQILRISEASRKQNKYIIRISEQAELWDKPNIASSFVAFELIDGTNLFRCKLMSINGLKKKRLMSINDFEFSFYTSLGRHLCYYYIIWCLVPIKHLVKEYFRLYFCLFL